MAIFFMSAKMVIFSTVQQKKVLVFCWLLPESFAWLYKERKLSGEKRAHFFVLFFPAKNLGYTSKSLQFSFSCLSIFFLSQLLKLLWLILIKQVVFEFYMLQHEIVQFYAALQQQQAMERDTAHNKKKISTLIVIYNRALQAKRLH